MSGPIRMRMGPRLAKLRTYLEETGPIVEAQERTPEGIEKLRENLIRIDGAVAYLEGQDNAWQQYMETLAVAVREAEGAIYEQFAQGGRHFYAWIDDARTMMIDMRIALADESDAGSDGPRDHIEIGNNERPSLAEGEIPVRNERENRGELGPVPYPKAPPWPYFFGEVLKWPAFWQQFEELVDRRPMSLNQKATLLIQSMKGRAQAAVDGYLPIGENYAPMLEALKRQFGNQKAIRESLQNEMINLSRANDSVESLKRCLESIERICRQLEVLGQDEGDQEFLLMMVKRKFPEEILLEAIKMEQNGNEKWGVKELRGALKEIIGMREEANRYSKMSIGRHPQGGGGYGNRENRRSQGNRDNNRGRDRDRNRDRNFHRAFAVKGGEGTRQNTGCLFCEGQHRSSECRKVADRMARVDILDEQRRCHRCLRNGHSTGQCTTSGCCSVCGGQHHRVICPSADMPKMTGGNKTKLGSNKGQKAQEGQQSTSKKTAGSAISGDEEILLMSARVQVYGGRDLTRKTSALIFFDNGSQVSFLSDRMIRLLSPPKVKDGMLELAGIRQRKPERINSGKYLVNLQLRDGTRQELMLNRIDFMLDKIKRANMKSGKIELVEEQPDILVGMPEFWRFFRHVEPISSNLFRVETSVGPIVCGRMEGMPMKGNFKGLATSVIIKEEREVEDEEKIKKFWELEAIGVKDCPIEDDDKIALEMFSNTVRNDEGRFVVSWPWKVAKEELPVNFTLAYRRFVSLMDKLKKSPELLDWYDQHMRKQMSEGIIARAETGTRGGYFMPHHVVVTSKKNRVVYDASAKMKGCLSLNDALYRGQVIMPALPGLLMRFRVPKVAMWADIQSAFWTLQLEEEDREYTKFLWLKDANKPISAENLLVLRFQRVPFGVVSSPFLLAASVRHHLRLEGSALAKEVEKNIYVDNVLVGCAGEDEAMEKYRKAKTLFREVQMNLREFITNSERVNNSIPKEDRLETIRPKVLGVMWEIDSDKISVDFPELKEVKASRRSVLKGLASVFDPLGWAAPCLLPAKLFLQKLWTKDRKWDDVLSKEEKDEWENLTSGWKNMSLICNRRVKGNGSGEIQLHVFVDASKEAYAACVYLRWQATDTQVSLLYARSRLKPRAMGVSIPRMELLGVLIGTRAIKMVAAELGLEVKARYLWCDSKPVLFWMKGRDQQPKFVANRLAEIRQNVGLKCRYIPTEMNPADVASRGCTPQELKVHPLWWTGPKWLANGEKDWPDEFHCEIEEEEENEYKAVVISQEHTESGAVLTAVAKASETLINFDRFSKWSKCVKVMARVMKMARNWCIKIGRRPSSRKFDRLSEEREMGAEDYARAERELIRQGQIEWDDLVARGQEIRTFVDGDGIRRLDTRVGKSEMGYEFNFPAVFPKGAPILELLAKKAHANVRHARIESTLNELRQECWSPRMRSLVKKVIRGCAMCQKLRGPAFALPPMPSHPGIRLRRSRPFEYVALDYLGPSEAKVDGKARKYWIALLTCLTTRAVYLEPVFDLTTASFLQILRRFAARRGMPSCIMSDNASTFKCAAKALGAVEAGKKSMEELEKYLKENKIGWKFVPALSPWANGLAERLVKICKDAFRSSVGRMVLTGEEIRTVTAEIEATMNNRPLTYVSDEAGSGMALRPIDFLNPGVLLGLPIPGGEEDDDDEDFRMEIGGEEDVLKKRWRKVGKVLEWYWERWNREYIKVLRDRTQWIHKEKHFKNLDIPKKGEVVLVEDEFRSRNCWPIGRIVEMNGAPGAIRSAKVRLAPKGRERIGRIIERPINKLYSLEASGQESDNDKHDREEENKQRDEERIREGADRTPLTVRRNNRQITNFKNSTNGNEENEKEPEAKCNHPMITRAKGRATERLAAYASVLFLIFLISPSLGGNVTLRECKGCKNDCVSKGVSFETPKRYEKVTVCCEEKCLTFPSGKWVYQIPKKELLVGYSCQFDYRTRKNRYKNQLVCLPVPECEIISCIFCWEMVLNPNCVKGKGTRYLLGGFALTVLFIFVTCGLCVLKCMCNIIWVVNGIGKILGCVSWPIRKLWACGCRKVKEGPKEARKREKIEELEMRTLVQIGTDSDDELYDDIKYRDEKKRRRNRRLNRLIGLATLLCFTLVLPEIRAAVEIAAIQATAEDCIKGSNGMVCEIKGATQLTIMPAGQKVELALKGVSGGLAGSLEITMQALRLHCNQQSLRWLRSYKVEIASAVRCPAMGSCIGRKCGHVRRRENLPELAEVLNFTGDTYCLEGQSYWGYQCALPSPACFFYKVYVVPTSPRFWEMVRCTGWDYEMKAKVKVEYGNMTVEEELILFPGITSHWGEWSFVPEGVTLPVTPVLADRFLISDEDEVVYLGDKFESPMECATAYDALNFTCKLTRELCAECWSDQEKSKVACGGCIDMNIEERDDKLPLYTSQLKLHNEKRRILSETEYAPVSVLVKVTGLKMLAVNEGAECWAESLGLSGCYNCETGGVLDFICFSSFGEVRAEIRCVDGPNFLAKCSEKGMRQLETLPFISAEVDKKCRIYCPAGMREFSFKGELVYLPLERNSEEVISKDTVGNGTTLWPDFWQWPKLSGVDWKYWSKFVLYWQNLPALITVALAFIGLLYLVLKIVKYLPALQGYRIALALLTLLFINFAAAGGPLKSGEIPKSGGVVMNFQEISRKNVESEGRWGEEVVFEEHIRPFCVHSVPKYIRFMAILRFILFLNFGLSSVFQEFANTSYLLEMFCPETRRDPPQKDFAVVAGDFFRCSPALVAYKIENSAHLDRLTEFLKRIEADGGALWYRIRQGVSVPIQEGRWYLDSDNYRGWGFHPELEWAERCGQREIVPKPFYRHEGPGFVMDRVFYPVGGVQVMGNFESEDFFGQFWGGVDPSVIQETGEESGGRWRADCGWSDEEPEVVGWGEDGPILDENQVEPEVPRESMREEPEGAVPELEPNAGKEAEGPDLVGALKCEFEANVRVGQHGRKRTIRGLFTFSVVLLLLLIGMGSVTAIGSKGASTEEEVNDGASQQSSFTTELANHLNPPTNVPLDQPEVRTSAWAAEQAAEAARANAAETAQRAGDEARRRAEAVAAAATGVSVVEGDNADVVGQAHVVHGGHDAALAVEVARHLMTMMPPPPAAVRPEAGGPVRGGNTQRGCYRCGELGHVVRRCPMAVVGGGAGGSRGVVARVEHGGGVERGSALRLCPTDVTREVREEYGRLAAAAGVAVGRLADLCRDFNPALAAIWLGFQDVFDITGELCRSGSLRSTR